LETAPVRSFHRSRRKSLPTGIPTIYRRICTPEHPLALFLDTCNGSTRQRSTCWRIFDPIGSTALMLIGAYRDNEVDATHPLAGSLRSSRTGAQIEEITLARSPANTSRS